MPPPEVYFILVYDTRLRSVDVKSFDRDLARAIATYSEIEAEHHDDPGIEIVLVGADSLETIKSTHSHYFKPANEDLFEQFLQQA